MTPGELYTCGKKIEQDMREFKECTFVPKINPVKDDMMKGQLKTWLQFDPFERLTQKRSEMRQYHEERLQDSSCIDTHMQT